MPFTISTTNLENDEVQITTDANGNLSIHNKANANTATIDETTNLSSKVSDGDGVERQIWVIAAGAADPAGAGPDDLIFEEQA